MQQRCKKCSTFLPNPKGRFWGPRDEADMDRSSHGSCSEDTSPPLEKQHWAPKSGILPFRDIPRMRWIRISYGNFRAQKIRVMCFFRWNPPDANQCSLQSQVTAAQIRGAAWCFCGPGSLDCRLLLGFLAFIRGPTTENHLGIKFSTSPPLPLNAGKPKEG